MNVSREAIMRAVMAIFQTAAPFKTVGRRVIPWAQAGLEFPCLFIRNTHEEHPQRVALGIPDKVTLVCELWMYSNAGTEKSVAPSSAINDLIDAIEAALQTATSKFDGKVQLQSSALPQGLVAHVWFEGTTQIDSGDMDSIGKAVAILKILVP